MSDDHPCMSSGAAALALKNHDVLCHMFEVHGDVSTRTRLSRKDLFCSSLVSRAFREPALRALWRDMSPPTPLWLLLAPRNSAAEILSERTHADPARWARFMWYARFVQELHITTFGLEHKHKQLICALVEHNGEESIFPSLQTLSWSPSSYSDTSYFPLFTPQLHSAILDLPHPSEADKDPQSHIFLAQLRASSPRLDYLCVDVSWEHIGVNHLGVIASFEHLTDLNLVASTSLTSFRELATMPCMNSLRIAYVRSDELEPSHPLAQIHAPRLTLISVGGNCPSLAQLFTALNAPVLASASFHAISDHPLTERYADYDLCIKALTTVCPPRWRTSASRSTRTAARRWSST
ncbi:hypothetical protein LXA43DRAFT_992389 [Ganoderma leucocontextum]|nr:hypothetical protein LXA43DRAFT_992389 [Ganoderma leucocontextum]